MIVAAINTPPLGSQNAWSPSRKCTSGNRFSMVSRFSHSSSIESLDSVSALSFSQLCPPAPMHSVPVSTKWLRPRSAHNRSQAGKAWRTMAE